MDILPFSSACERNKSAILAILKSAFANTDVVLEIGSGTGQHAVHMSQFLPHLGWHPSDLPANQPALKARVKEAALKNLHLPVALDVTQHVWPVPAGLNGLFSANTLHIMDEKSVALFFAGIGRFLKPGGVVCIYGPFNYHGKYTSKSNAAFDHHLKQTCAHQGIREFETLCEYARSAGLNFCNDYAMPADNHILHWIR